MDPRNAPLLRLIRTTAALALTVLAAPTLALAQTCCAPAGLDVVAWWPLDEQQGTTAAELTGQHPGTHVNGPTPVDGVVQQALEFDGTDDYVTVPDSDDWTFPGDFTIELWARWDEPIGSDCLVGHNEGGGSNNKWFFLADSTSLKFHVNTPNLGTGVWMTAPFVPETGRWYHLAVTRTGTTYSFHVDGAVVGSVDDPTPIPNANAPLVIGWTEGSYMNGSLDELGIYPRALTATELQAIVAAGATGKCGLVDCNANAREDAFDACSGSSPDHDGDLTPDECQPVNYCTAGVSASGCTAALSVAGLPSASAPSGFTVTATGVEGAKDGLVFWGVSGRQANPWGTGYRCVVPPVKRTQLLQGQGTSGACDGLATVDLNARWCPTCPKPTQNPGFGTTIYIQFWYRDPWNTMTNKDSNFSDAIETTVGP